MAATYHQLAMASFQSAVYGLYNRGSNGIQVHNTEMDPMDNMDQVHKYQLPSLSSGSLVGVPIQPANMVKTDNYMCEDGQTDARVYTQVKPDLFACDECGKSFKSRNYLKIHMRIHSGEKPFPCTLCTLSFTIRGNLLKHMRTHSGVKNYACKYCGHMFRDSSSRSRHERLHTGEMPYRCQHCDQSFRYREIYKTHMISVHGLEEKDVVALPVGKRSRSEKRSVDLNDSVHKSSFDSLSLEEGNDMTGTSAKKLKLTEVDHKALPKNTFNLSTNVEENVFSPAMPSEISTQISVETSDTVHDDNSLDNVDMESLNGDNDLSFENASPDELMPPELQSQSTGQTNDCPKVGALHEGVHQLNGTSQLKHFQCEKCPKNFCNKSQLTRHQKMHKLLTVGTTECRTVYPVANDQLVSNSHVSPIDKITHTQGFHFRPSCQTNESELPLDLTSENSLSNSVADTADISNQKVGVAFPETLMHELSSQEESQNIEGHETFDVSQLPVEDTCEPSTAALDRVRGQAIKMRETHEGSSPVTEHEGSDGVECNICGKILRKGSYLKAHMRIHSGEKPHICTYCGRGFSVSQNLYKHLRTHTGEKNYSCPTCGRKFNTSSSRNRHMVLHTGDKPYPCQLCSEQFKYLDSLKYHCLKYHPSFNLRVGQMREYSRTNDFEKQVTTLPGPRNDVSNGASSHVLTAQDVANNILKSLRAKNLPTQSNFFRQSKNKQETDTNNCEDSMKLKFPYDPPCVDTASSYSAFQERPVKCQTANDLSAEFEGPSKTVTEINCQEFTMDDIDGNSDSTVAQNKIECDAVIEHVSTESGVTSTSMELDEEIPHCLVQSGDEEGKSHKSKEPCFCPVCHCELHSWSYLKDHMKTHTGERPHMCLLCGHSFAQKHNLIVHLRMHTGEKRFSCKICDKQFALKHTLNRHMLIHTGEKPHECVVCKFRFTYLDLLKQHYKKNHPNFDIASLKLKRGKPRSNKSLEEDLSPTNPQSTNSSTDLPGENDSDKNKTAPTELINACSRELNSSENPDDQHVENFPPVMLKNYNTLSRSETSHRKQVSPMKLPTVLYVTEDVDNDNDAQDDSVEASTSIEIMDQEEWKSQNDREEDFIITVNQETKSDEETIIDEEINIPNPSSVFKCSQCPVTCHDEERLLIHSQTHKLQAEMNHPEKDEELHWYAYPKQLSTDVLQPVNDIMNSPNTALVSPKMNCSWSKSILSAVSSISSDCLEKQYYQNRLATSIALGIRPSQCPICCAVFSSSRKFQRHMAEHQKHKKPQDNNKLNTDIHQQDGCDIQLPLTVDNRVQEESSGESPKLQSSQTFLCQTPRVTVNQSLHKSTSLVPNSVVCSQCNTLFPSYESLAAHARTHLTLTCQDCGYISASQEEIDTHKKTHLKENQENADATQAKNVPVRDGLKTTVYRDTEVQDAGVQDVLVECRLCPGTFTSYKDLKQHLKLHEGRPVFVCPLCTDVFTDQDLLMKHMNEHA